MLAGFRVLFFRMSVPFKSAMTTLQAVQITEPRSITPDRKIQAAHGGITSLFSTLRRSANLSVSAGIGDVKYVVSKCAFPFGPILNFPNGNRKALTGERIHDKCFVCGPKGIHYEPPLPPYPHEWNCFIGDPKTAGISRKLNNIFSLTAIGVYDGDFMKFPDGISAVTLAGGCTYHRMLPSHEGQHAIRWFIHDPAYIFTKGGEMHIPDSWINRALAGLEHVNPFIAELEKLSGTTTTMILHCISNIRRAAAMKSQVSFRLLLPLHRLAAN